MCRMATAFAWVIGLISIGTTAPAADVHVVLDVAMLMKLPERTATVVIGNPLIADLSLVQGNLMVLTGKGNGETNVVVMDRSGATLMERSVEVGEPYDMTVVCRAQSRQSYSCSPDCNPRADGAQIRWASRDVDKQ